MPGPEPDGPFATIRPMQPRPISRDTARLFLVRRHMLAPPRSLPPGRESVMAAVERLGSLQFDPLDIAGRNHDLVLLSRVAGYRRAMTDALLYEERRLFEAYNKGLSILPTHELPWFRQTWDEERLRHEGAAFVEHADLVAEILGRITTEGPLSVTDLEARPPIDWYWRPTNPVRAMFEALAEAGVLGFARRQGNRRYYDLAERLFPEELRSHRPEPREQRRHRLLSRYRGHGLLGRSGPGELWNGTAPSARSARYDGPTRGELLAELVAAGTLVPVAVDGVRGDRLVLGEEQGLLDAAERDAVRVRQARGSEHRADRDPLDPAGAGVAFLAPLDPLAWDRDLLRSLFDFDYRWEVYIPERKRTWGYYVLPVLWGDRFVGRIEPRVDRDADALRVLAVTWEPGFDPVTHPAFMTGFAEALEAHRAFADAGRVLLPRMTGSTALRGALRELLPALGGRARTATSDTNRRSGRCRPAVGP